MRRVVSVFLPNFCTDRICASRGASRASGGGPLVTARHDGRKRVIAAACPDARALGLYPGQTVAHAQALVPGLAVTEAEPDADAAALGRLAQACLRYAPLTTPDPPDGILIETTGCDHLFGGEPPMLADLLGRLERAGFSARAAVAGTPGAAHALARFAAQDATVLQGPAQTALNDLPVACLRLPDETLAALRRVGLDRVGQLNAARAPLARRFGPLLLQRLDQAFGRIFEPIMPVLPEKIFAHCLAFAEPLTTPENLQTVMPMLTQAVCTHLERAGQGARKLDLLFERVDGAWQAIRIGTARPTRAPAHLARLLAERLDTVDPGLGIEAMRLVVTLSESLGWTQQRTDAPAPGQGVAELVDRLAGRFGAARVYRAVPVESAIPERSVARLPPLAPPSGRRWPPSLPRPPRLFDPPQPVDAIALLPDRPPVAFVWRKLRHLVRRADGPERIFGEWWRRDAEVAAVRDYFAVEDEAGRRFWLYRRGDGVDPATGDLRWFLHGLF